LPRPPEQPAQRLRELFKWFGKIVQCPGHLPEYFYQLPQSPGQLAGRFRQLPEWSRQLPERPGQLAGRSGQLPERLGQLPEKSGQLNYSFRQNTQPAKIASKTSKQTHTP